MLNLKLNTELQSSKLRSSKTGSLFSCVRGLDAICINVWAYSAIRDANDTVTGQLHPSPGPQLPLERISIYTHWIGLGFGCDGVAVGDPARQMSAMA